MADGNITPIPLPDITPGVSTPARVWLRGEVVFEGSTTACARVAGAYRTLIENGARFVACPRPRVVREGLEASVVALQHEARS